MSDGTPSSSPAPVPAPTLAALHNAAPRTRRQRIADHLRSVLIAGAITLIPLFITIFILRIVFQFLTGPATPIVSLVVEPVLNIWWTKPLETAPDYRLYSNTVLFIQLVLAFVITVATIYALGVLSIFTVGRGILARMERFFENLPLIKGIYGTTKQVITVFRHGGGGAGFQRIVIVEFPRHGTWTIAFVTNTINDGPDHRLVCCFIPMTPNPTSGFFQMFRESEVRNTDWSVDTGIKIILSGGLLAPHDLPPATPSPISQIDALPKA